MSCFWTDKLLGFLFRFRLLTELVDYILNPHITERFEFSTTRELDADCVKFQAVFLNLLRVNINIFPNQSADFIRQARRADESRPSLVIVLADETFALRLKIDGSEIDYGFGNDVLVRLSVGEHKERLIGFQKSVHIPLPQELLEVNHLQTALVVCVHRRYLLHKREEDFIHLRQFDCGRGLFLTNVFHHSYSISNQGLKVNKLFSILLQSSHLISSK